MAVGKNILMPVTNTDATGSTPIAYRKDDRDRSIDFISVDGTPGSWKIQGSDDNATWVDILAGITAIGAHAIVQNYKYYRVFCTTHGTTAPVIRYYGREGDE